MAECVIAAILQIAVDRAAAAGELHAQLVLATRVRAEFEPRQPVVSPADHEQEPLKIRSRWVLLHDFHACLRLVFLQPVFERTGVLRHPRTLRSPRRLSHNGPVLLLDHPLAELLAQARGGLTRTREE